MIIKHRSVKSIKALMCSNYYWWLQHKVLRNDIPLRLAFFGTSSPSWSTCNWCSVFSSGGGSTDIVLIRMYIYINKWQLPNILIYTYVTYWYCTAYRYLTVWFFDIDKLVQCETVFFLPSCFWWEKKIQEKIEYGLHWKFWSCPGCGKPYIKFSCMQIKVN